MSDFFLHHANARLIRHPISTGLRLRVAEVAARAGRSCVLLLLVLWPPSLSGRLRSRSRRGARARVPALRKPKQLGAGPGGKAGERVAEGAARTGGRP